MFNKSDSDKIILQRKLDEAEKLLKAIQENRSDIFIVKLFPENADQFELNGEFVVDNSQAVYGSHKLTFSESVLFKAGKEAATRQFEVEKSELLSQLKALQVEIAQLNAQIEETESVYEEYKRTSLEHEIRLNESISAYAKRLKNSCDHADAVKQELQSNIVELQAKVDNLKASVDYWKAKYMTDPEVHPDTGDVYTPFGVIRG